jgi:5-methyltetrahydrofolate--homocysteine methyltransferase
MHKFIQRGKIKSQDGITHMSKFIRTLNQRNVLVADGATGTQLLKAGLTSGVAPESWNLDNPEAIRTLHRSYLDAGADIVLTNTFGATRIRLERHQLQDKVISINSAAARLAREAAGAGAFVFGDIGPTGGLLKPYGKISFEDAQAAFREVLVTFSFDSHGRTMMGLTPEKAARTIWSLGVTAVGANCGRTLSETLTAIEQIHMAVPEAVLMAKPNAGLPHTSDGNIVYDVTPEVMVGFAHQFVAQGVKIFGGCCGSTPEHIQAIARALK